MMNSIYSIRSQEFRIRNEVICAIVSNNQLTGKISVVLTLLLSACASGPGKTGWYDQWGSCAAVGAAVGVATGGAAEDVETALAAGLGGFVIGGALCAVADTDADGVKNYKDDCPGTAAGPFL